MTGDRRGSSVIEVMVALAVLGLGVLALAGGPLAVSRDLAGGRQATAAALMAEARLETLRLHAGSTPTRCASPRFASALEATDSAGVSISWRVPPAGALRTVQVISTYATGRGRVATDTLTGAIRC